MLIIELDPMAYMFGMDELITTTLGVLDKTVESVQDWAAVPVVSKHSRGKNV